MKSITLLTTLVLGLCVSAHGAFSFSYSSDPGSIPDGNLSGWTSTATPTFGSSATIQDVQVTLNLSGGYNGDLYAYLSYDGKLLPLLTRIGSGSVAFGNPAAGMTVTLADSASGNIHAAAAGTPNGTYRPDGLALSTSSPYDALAGTPATFNSAFYGMTLDPAKNWTLFIADVSGGGGSGNSTLTSWQLQVTAVPEPVNVALAVFGLCAVGVGAGRRYFAKAKSKA
jgi:hypothetical protein